MHAALPLSSAGRAAPASSDSRPERAGAGRNVSPQNRPVRGPAAAARVPPGTGPEVSAGPSHGQSCLIAAALARCRVPLLMVAAHQRRGNQEIRGSPVAGNRDIADHRDPEQGLDIRVMRMWLQRVPQKHQQVDLAFGDAGTDLLVTAVRAAPEAGDRQPELLLQEVTGGGRGEQLVTGQQVQVVLGPLEHVPLLVVVRDQGNPPPCRRRRVVGHANPLRRSLPGSGAPLAADSA